MNKFFPIVFLFLFFKTTAQVPMEVIRTKAVDRYSPVTNIFIDAENNKWAGNRKGLSQIFSPEQGNPVKLDPAEWSLLQTPSGNYDLRIPLEQLISQMGSEGQSIRSKDDRITAATFDEKRSELWVGTWNSGLFQFKTQPALKLMQRHHTGNSKLISNRIHTLFLDHSGRLWIGTEEGCVYGKDGKWKLEEKYFSIKAFAQNETDVWVMGNDLLWKVNAREFWEPVDIDEKLTEREVVDIAFDGNGMLWIASEIIARFDPATETSKIFGPAEEFTSQDVSCMAIDRENAVWIGTNDKGLYVIQKTDAIAVTCLIDKNLSCGANQKDAALKVTVSGGETPYTYLWAGGLTGTNPQNLGPGEYALTVTDAKGKSKSTKTTIPDPNLSLTGAQDKPAAEDGSPSGGATVKVQGGNPAYTFKWDNGETMASATKLSEGAHTVTVTDKAGCAATASINVSRKVGALAISISQTKNINCAGGAEASLKAEVSGGKAPYQYQWTSGVMTGETATGLASGSYAVTVADATGQSATAQFVVKEPQAVAATVKVETPASTGNSDGKATTTATGGSGNFTFKWDNGETTATAAKLAPGRRSVTVTDGAGCTATATVTISENILPLAVSISQKQEVKCAGQKTAALLAEVSGGKAPFKFQWNANGLAGENVTGIPAGGYAVTVTDATGQTSTAGLEVKEPKPAEATAKVEAPASTGNSDGKATAKASGGTGNFTFRWDNGETTATATKLGPGNHAVTVTDEAGCTATASISISENILPLAVSISQKTEIKCAGEKSAALAAEVSGGKGPFRLAWTGGVSGETASSLAAGSYDVTVTDATGTTATTKILVKEPKPVEATAKVDAPASTGNADGKATAKASGGTGNFTFRWDNGETAATATKLGPGNHAVTVTDEAGCTATASISISENILPLAVSISQKTEIKCAGEKSAALAAEVSGGKGPFQFAWTGGASGETASALAAGSYDVTVTDATGTTATSKILVKEPKPVEATAKVDAPASTGNSDGKATAKASGGTGNFTFRWDNGETAATALKLGPGNHAVTVTDETGCTATASVSISENILPLAVSISQKTEIKCAGEKSAALAAEVSGGKGPFQFAWTGGASGETASALAAGSYDVTVTDATGTTASVKFAVKEPPAIKAEITKTRPTSTEKTSNGKAFTKVEGGAGGYTFKWDDSETTVEASNLAAGPHSVTISDANGCLTVLNFETKIRIIPELTAETLRGGEVIKLEKIYFQPDSTNMDASSLPTVDELYEFLEENPGIVIEVGGHTNNIPSHEFCDALSSARAKSVAQYLVGKGLPANRITFRGYGKRNPIATNATPEGRAKNQRVEIKIVRLDGD